MMIPNIKKENEMTVKNAIYCSSLVLKAVIQSSVSGYFFLLKEVI